MLRDSPPWRLQDMPTPPVWLDHQTIEHLHAESQNPLERRKPPAWASRPSDPPRALGNALPGPHSRPPETTSLGVGPCQPQVLRGLLSVKNQYLGAWLGDRDQKKQRSQLRAQSVQTDPYTPVSCRSLGEQAGDTLGEAPYACRGHPSCTSTVSIQVARKLRTPLD